MRQFGLKRGMPRPPGMIEQAREPVVIAAPAKPPTKKKMSAKEFRERVWAQNPRCHWCGCVTVLPATKRPQPNWATLDHLVSRLQAKRRDRQPGERRWVLACWACNARRNDEEQRETPIEELQIRSGRTPRDPVTGRCELLTPNDRTD